MQVDDQDVPNVEFMSSLNDIISLKDIIYLAPIFKWSYQPICKDKRKGPKDSSVSLIL